MIVTRKYKVTVTAKFLDDFLKVRIFIGLQSYVYGTFNVLSEEATGFPLLFAKIIRIT